MSADVSDVDYEGRVNLQENLFYHDGNLVNNHLRLDRSTLTKKCGIFRQGVCDFDVLCLFKVHFANKTAVFSSKSQSGLAMITNPDLYQ